MDLFHSHFRLPIHWQDKYGVWQSASCDLEDFGVRKLIGSLRQWTRVFVGGPRQRFLRELSAIVDQAGRFIPEYGEARMETPAEIVAKFATDASGNFESGGSVSGR